MVAVAHVWEVLLVGMIGVEPIVRGEEVAGDGFQAWPRGVNQRLSSHRRYGRDEASREVVLQKDS